MRKFSHVGAYAHVQITKNPRTHDSWFPWHKDFDILTALTPAMYLKVDDPDNEVPCPDPVRDDRLTDVSSQNAK
jgi:hypothetical protein